ncbi:MAG: YutD-like domain-containing protein [Bacilli bacterium]
MKIIEVENQKYELIKDYKNGFNLDEFLNSYTDYFEDYDYVVGDIAYSKLRLKGFYDPQNKKVKEINNYKNFNKYLEEDCAVDCRYFILKKIKGEQ